MIFSGPTLLWQQGFREIGKLALQVVILDPTLTHADISLRTRMIGRALGIPLDRVSSFGCTAAEIMAAHWAACNASALAFHLTELFGIPTLPATHRCAPIYGALESLLPGLQTESSSENAMVLLTDTIRQHRRELTAMFAEVPTHPPTIEPSAAAGRILNLAEFLVEIKGVIAHVSTDLKASAARLHALLRLIASFCHAVSDGRSDQRFPLSSPNTNPYLSEDDDLRRAIRRLLHEAPEPTKREFLSHLADFGPEPIDRDLFHQRFAAGDTSALALILRLWPDAEAVGLIEQTLETGLASPPESLALPKRGQSSSLALTPLGKQVESAIFFSHKHLEPSRAIRYLVAYLRDSTITNLQRAATRALGEAGGDEAGIALSAAVQSARDLLLSDVAEAIARVPTNAGIDALLDRLPDRSLRLNRLEIIDTLAACRPDDRFREQLLLLIQEPGCRCAGCVWRKSLRTLATKWNDDRSREVVEDRLAIEPGYEGRLGAARILAAHWPDQRTIELLSEPACHQITGTGEGEFGHLPFDGNQHLMGEERHTLSAKMSAKLAGELDQLRADLQQPPAEESVSAPADVDWITRMLIEAAARRSPESPPESSLLTAPSD
jgi:hypothetical protein